MALKLNPCVNPRASRTRPTVWTVSSVKSARRTGDAFNIRKQQTCFDQEMQQIYHPIYAIPSLCIYIYTPHTYVYIYKCIHIIDIYTICPIDPILKQMTILPWVGLAILQACKLCATIVTSSCPKTLKPAGKTMPLGKQNKNLMWVVDCGCWWFSCWWFSCWWWWWWWWWFMMIPHCFLKIRLVRFFLSWNPRLRKIIASQLYHLWRVGLRRAILLLGNGWWNVSSCTLILLLQPMYFVGWC